MKNIYEVPEMEIILFSKEDVIKTSGDEVKVDWGSGSDGFAPED